MVVRKSTRPLESSQRRDYLEQAIAGKNIRTGYTSAQKLSTMSEAFKTESVVLF